MFQMTAAQLWNDLHFKIRAAPSVNIFKSSSNKLKDPAIFRVVHYVLRHEHCWEMSVNVAMHV